MKTLQNLIVTAVITLTGVFLPITPASAIDEPSYFVPIQPCRLFNTLKMQSQQFPEGGANPFVATKVRSGHTMFDSKNFVINDAAISGAVKGQGGSVDPDTGVPLCNIPNNALAIHINVIATITKGGVGWLRAWPYAGTNPGEADFATANILVWNADTVISNATPVSLADETGLRFTLRAFFDVSSDQAHPENFSTHMTGDALGYYLPFTP